MFVFHRDELHAHTLFGATSLDSGTSAYLTCRRINKQLNEGSSCRGIGGSDVQSAQPEVVHFGNHSLVEAVPSDNCPLRGRKARKKAQSAILVYNGGSPSLFLALGQRRESSRRATMRCLIEFLRSNTCSITAGFQVPVAVAHAIPS